MNFVQKPLHSLSSEPSISFTGHLENMENTEVQYNVMAMMFVMKVNTQIQHLKVKHQVNQIYLKTTHKQGESCYNLHKQALYSTNPTRTMASDFITYIQFSHFQSDIILAFMTIERN